MHKINRDGTKRFHPLVYALAHGKIELVLQAAVITYGTEGEDGCKEKAGDELR